MRHRIITIIGICAVALFFTNCHGDGLYSLGGDYYWCNQRIYKSKDGYGVDKSLVKGFVHGMGYDFNDDFIIARQEHSGVDFEDPTMIEKDTFWLNRINLIRQMGTCYWIIRKRDAQVFGPYDKEEFEKQRNSLNVSSDLEIY